jgi:hypothetical protein
MSLTTFDINELRGARPLDALKRAVGPQDGRASANLLDPVHVNVTAPACRQSGGDRLVPEPRMVSHRSGTAATCTLSTGRSARPTGIN